MAIVGRAGNGKVRALQGLTAPFAKMQMLLRYRNTAFSLWVYCGKSCSKVYIEWSSVRSLSLSFSLLQQKLRKTTENTVLGKARTIPYEGQ